jgi:hypothetical protein
MCANSVLMRKKADQGGRGCGKRVAHSWTPAEENKNLAVCVNLKKVKFCKGRCGSHAKKSLQGRRFMNIPDLEIRWMM